MLTNNWYEYFRVSFGAPANGTNTTADVYDCDGVSYHPRCKDELKSYIFPHEATTVKTKYEYGVIFGNGTAAPAKTDYTLSGDIITTISTVSSAYEGEHNGDESTFVCTYVLKNTGESDITISEVGWVGTFGIASATSSKKFLLDRTLLDTPVTIAAGEQGAVVYKRSITVPS